MNTLNDNMNLNLIPYWFHLFTKAC